MGFLSQRERELGFKSRFASPDRLCYKSINLAARASISFIALPGLHSFQSQQWFMNMAKQIQTQKRLLTCGLCATFIAFSGIFAGCDSGGSSSGGSSSSVKLEAKIAGSVSDHIGALSAGKLEVKDKTGAVVATTQYANSRYSLSVPASAVYPIMLIAYPPEGSVSMAPVKAVVTSPIADKMDISSVTNLVVDSALMMAGGLTPENIAKASGGAIGMRQAQGVSAGAGGSGGGAGNSGGGTGQGGHGGHNMADMAKDRPAKTEEETK